MATYNLFEVTDSGMLSPLAVNVPADELGDDIESVIETIAGMGYARVGGGAAPLFHVEQCTDASADMDSVVALWA